MKPRPRTSDVIEQVAISVTPEERHAALADLSRERRWG